MFLSKISDTVATPTKATRVRIWSRRTPTAWVPVRGRAGAAGRHAGAAPVQVLVEGVRLVGVDPHRHQLATAEHDEQDRRHHRVDDQAGQEDRDLARRQAGVLHDGVGDDAVDADRREAAGLGAVHHEHAHHQRADAVAAGEAEGDRADDRAGGRADGADAGQDRGHREHHPRDERHPSTDGSYGGAHDEVDRPVVARDGEQVRDADQGEDEVTADPAEDLLLVEVEGVHADEPRRDVRQRPHVDGQHRAHDEQGDQRDDRHPFRSHRRLLLPAT